MKLLVALALVLTIASAFDLRDAETNSSSPVVSDVKKEGRIFNGKTATKGQFPYQVGLSLKKKDLSFKFCGGSLIGNQWVLTAAHCVSNKQLAIVRLGAFERTNPEVSLTVSNKNFISHPHWNKETFLNDIALIKIPKVRLSRTIQVVKLPARTGPHSSYIGKSVIATGWGRTSANDEGLPEELRYARMKVVSNSVCKLAYDEPFTRQMICAAAKNSASICAGDSGGPLVLESNKVQIGLTAFAGEDGCGFPAAFTRLTSHLDWIHSHTGIAY